MSSSSDIGFKVKASKRKQRGLAKQPSGKKDTFNIFEDEQPKSAVVNKAQLDALYDLRDAHAAPASESQATTIKLTPGAKYASSSKPPTKSPVTEAERKVSVSTSPVRLAKTTTATGKTWSATTAPPAITIKHSTSSANGRPPVYDSHAASFPKLGNKQASAVKAAAPASTTAPSSKSDGAHRAANGFTVVGYSKRGKERKDPSTDPLTVATNMANNKFEPLMSQDNSQPEVRVPKSKPASSTQKKNDRASTSNLLAGSNASQKAITKKENQVWTTVGSKKPGKPTKTSLKHPSETKQAQAPRPQKPQPSSPPNVPAHLHKDAEFPPLVAPVKDTKKVPSRSPVVELSTPHTSRPHQPASSRSATSESHSSKDTEFPPLPASPSEPEKKSSKTTVAKASKQRRRKRAASVVAPKAGEIDETVAVIKSVSAPVLGKAGVESATASKKASEPQVTSSSQADTTTGVAPIIPTTESTLPCADVDQQLSTSPSESVSFKPSNPPALSYVDARKSHNADETSAPFGDSITARVEYAALESRMALHFGSDDLLIETEEHHGSVSTIEPATLGEAHQYQQVLETSFYFGVPISEGFNLTAMESRALLFFGSDDLVPEEDGTLASANGLFAEGFDFIAMESRTLLYFDSDNMVSEAGEKAVSVNHLSAGGFEHDVIDSRMTLGFGFDDFIDDFEDSTFMEDVSAEEVPHGEASDTSCKEDAADDTSTSGTSTPTSPVTEDMDVSTPMLEVDAVNGNTARLTNDEARTNQMFMGTARIMDMLEMLEELSHKSNKNGMCTKSQVVEVFALFSTRERELAGFEPLCDISNGRNILKSIILQHKMCLGRTKLVDFLEMIHFENKLATKEAVAVACHLASEKEKEFWESDIGKEIGEIMRTLV